jgi:hypothetical protein
MVDTNEAVAGTDWSAHPCALIDLFATFRYSSDKEQRTKKIEQRTKTLNIYYALYNLAYESQERSWGGSRQGSLSCTSSGRKLEKY